MSILLDTNVIVDYLRGKLEIYFSAQNEFYISVITYIELLYGASKSQKPNENTAELQNFLFDFNIQILEITAEIAQTFIKEKLRLEKQGEVIEDADLFIAATALVEGIKLATQNDKHFRRITGLEIIQSQAIDKNPIVL